MIVGYRTGSNGPTGLYYELVQVAVQYTVPLLSATAIQTKALEENTVELKQYHRTIVLKGLEQGHYKMRVTDLGGRVLQERLITAVGDQTVFLNEQCRGYCFITVTGRGRRGVLKVFVQ